MVIKRFKDILYDRKDKGLFNFQYLSHLKCVLYYEILKNNLAESGVLFIYANNSLRLRKKAISVFKNCNFE
jgi:hypothetical protein